jgi:hypothetical protein
MCALNGDQRLVAVASQLSSYPPVEGVELEVTAGRIFPQLGGDCERPS